MKALLFGLSVFFVYFFVKSYIKYRKFNKLYRNEYIKILSSDEYKVKGKFE